MRIIPSLCFVLVATGAAVVACSSTSSTSTPAAVCPTDLFACPAGQSCWAKDNSGVFGCIPSGTGTKGAVCQSILGQAACADGLACFQLLSAGTGTCVSYCEPGSTKHGCEAGEQCAEAHMEHTSAVLHICVAMTTPGSDAGHTDGGGSDAGDTDAGGTDGGDTDAGSSDGGDASAN